MVAYELLARQVQADDHNRLGQRELAIEVLRTALDEDGDQPYALGLRVDLGTYLRANHEFGQGLAELRAAESAIEELRRGDPPDYLVDFVNGRDVILRNELGQACTSLGMNDQALAYFEQARALALEQEAEGPANWGANLVYRLHLATSRLATGEVEPLRAHYESHEWRERLPAETRGQIEMRLAIARTIEARFGKRPPGDGEAELREVLDSGLKVEEQLMGCSFLAQSLLDRGELDEAELWLEKASALSGPELSLPRTQLQLSGLRALLARRRAAPLAVRRDLLERELRPTLDSFLARARQGPMEEAGVSLLHYDWSRAAWAELFESELDCAEEGDGPERAFDWLARLHAAGTLARALGLPAPGLPELRAELLGPHSALLAYAPGRVQSHAFWLTRSDLEVVRLGGSRELEQAAREVEDALRAALQGSASSEQLRALQRGRLDARLDAATDLFLPSELQDRLAGQDAVHVVGLDDFGYVPFEALRGFDGRPVGFRLEIVHQPSLPLALALARRAAAAPGPRPGAVPRALLFLGSGDPARGGRPRLASLPMEPSELDIAALDRAGLEVAVLGPSELPSLGAGLAEASFAAFLAHGLYDPARLRPAGLLLDPERPGGAWFAGNFEERSAPPLVLVAACGADLAPLRRGDDGSGHLRAAFFRAGSACVAAATLPLELEATQTFLASVHRALADGQTAARAFLEARRELGSGDPAGIPEHALLLQLFGAGDRLRLPVHPAAPSHERAGPSIPEARSRLAWWIGAGLACALAWTLSRRSAWAARGDQERPGAA